VREFQKRKSAAVSLLQEKVSKDGAGSSHFVRKAAVFPVCGAGEERCKLKRTLGGGGRDREGWN
jgi:hypothetical protein